jgi:hypothetical protein
MNKEVSLRQIDVRNYFQMVIRLMEKD